MRLRAILVAAAFCAVPFAHADTFNFNAQSGAGGFSGSGTLTATANPANDGSYTIVDISGPGISGLIDPGQFQFNDNQLFPDQATLLDINGFAFNDVMGDTSYQINIFNENGGYFAVVGNQLFDTTFSVSAVTPEPSSIVLLGTGLLGLAGMARRRFTA